MKYAVLLTQEAEDDLLTLYLHVSENETAGRADRLLARLEKECQGLAALPRRGHVPPELERIGITDFREVHLRPYRMVYEITGRAVHVHAVLDGRRDLQDLLARRLLR